MNLDIRTRARLPSVVPSLGCSRAEKPMQIRRSDLHAVVLLYLSAAHVLPRVPLVRGFCLCVAREAIDRIGFFDEASFPNGYGEENDYCVRAVNRGFSLVIATHTYVFHAKSKSYAGPERVALMKAGSETLGRLHGRARIQRSVRSMQDNPILGDLRQRAQTLQNAPIPRRMGTSKNATLTEKLDGGRSIASR